MRSWIIILACAVSFPSAYSQTCCSGGVPLSGNVGFSSFEPQLFQFDLSYDLNYLNSLYNESEVLDDGSRVRTTQSILFKSGYTISKHFATDILFTYVFQQRVIEQFGNVTTDLTSGIGDAVLLFKYLFQDNRYTGINGQLGFGPKLPLAATDRTNDLGFQYSADLQPGSGSWDMFSWMHLSRQSFKRPQRNFNLSFTYRLNGKNRDYLGFSEYQFGNSYQLILGFGDQILLADRPVSFGLSARHRRAFPDKLNGRGLDNTGGSWLYIVPAIGIGITQNTLFSIVPEIPLFSFVEGTQLTTTFRLRAGFYVTIKPKMKIENESLF